MSDFGWSRKCIKLKIISLIDYFIHSDYITFESSVKWVTQALLILL